MPEHTKTTRKSASEPKKAKAKRAGQEDNKTPKIPKAAVRKVGPGVGMLEIPIHLSDGPQRLPEDEASYIHRARPTEAPPSKGQVQAVAAFKRGETLPEIAKATGLPFGTLIKTLKSVGLSEETHKKEIDSLQHYFDNRRNP